MSNRWSRLAPLTGVVFVILLVLSAIVVGNPPKTTASGAAVISYAKGHQGGHRASAILIGISLFIGLFFFGQLRSYLRRDPALETLAAISYGGGVLFAAGGGAVAGVALALADQPSKLDPAAAQALNMLYTNLPLVLFVGAGVLMFGAGLAIVRRRVLPIWLGWAGLVLGVVAAFPLGAFALILVAAWTLAVSIVMTGRAGEANPSVVTSG